MTEFTLDLAKQLVSSDEQFPVLFDSAYEWLGYSRKDSAKRAFLNCGFIEGVDFSSLHSNVEVQIEGTREVKREVELIKLTIDCFKMWAMLSKTEQGNKVRLYFLECERVAKQTVVIPTEVLQFMTSMQQQMQVLTERTKQLDQVKEENVQLNNQLNATASTLDSLYKAGIKHDGCFNIINSEVNSTGNRLLTAPEFLELHGYDKELSILLSRRTANFYRCSLKQDPYKNAENVTVFEERYLRESYEAIQALLNLV